LAGWFECDGKARNKAEIEGNREGKAQEREGARERGQEAPSAGGRKTKYNFVLETGIQEVAWKRRGAELSHATYLCWISNRAGHLPGFHALFKYKRTIQYNTPFRTNTPFKTNAKQKPTTCSS